MQFICKIYENGVRRGVVPDGSTKIFTSGNDTQQFCL